MRCVSRKREDRFLTDARCEGLFVIHFDLVHESGRSRRANSDIKYSRADGALTHNEYEYLSLQYPYQSHRAL